MRWLVGLAALLAVGLQCDASAGPVDCPNPAACATAGDGGVGVDGTRPSQAPGGGGNGPAHHFIYSYVPTCPANGPDNVATVCQGSVTACPSRGLTGVQVWVYRREVDRTGAALGPWELIDTICEATFTPTTPAQLRTILLSDSRFIPAPTSQTRINPSSGRSVINAEVVFSADTPPAYSVDVPILGFTVHLDLAPQLWEWHFGDGQTALTQTPGRPYPAKDVVHRYRRTGTFAPWVTVTWGGTFTFNGVAYPINGTTTVDGPTSAVSIAQAKSHLVGGHG